MHDRAAEVVEDYLRLVDAEAPGLVEGLYLTGSIALGEFRPRTSDVDFVAVTASPLGAPATAALARVHGRLRAQRPRPFFDGVYVTWEDLARDPRLAAARAHVLNGRFTASGSGECHPVGWHTLASHGVRCRGPERAGVAIWTDAAALAAWTLGNFDTYWRPLLRRARSFHDPWSLIACTSYGAVWIALGVCRLHATLATGAIVSKEEAGVYGLRAFPAHWHRILNEALRIRRADRAGASAASAAVELVRDLGGSLYRTPLARRRDVLAFADMVIADARQTRVA